jgi:hypothetical protein
MREWSVISANCLCRAILNNERSVAHHAFLHVTAGGVDVVIELSRAVLSVRLSEVTMKRGLASPSNGQVIRGQLGSFCQNPGWRMILASRTVL